MKDELDLAYRLIAEACKTVDEEAHMFDWWIASEYQTTGLAEELHRYRLMIRQRGRRQRLRAKPSLPVITEAVEPCEPEDLVENLTKEESLVWRLRADGWDQAAIGEAIGRSQSTVSAILDRIQIKFQEADARAGNRTRGV